MDFKQIKSSNLKEAAYDAESKKLQIRFKNGGLYEYFDVKPEIYEKFENTFQKNDSSGKFFLENIIHKHTCLKVDEKKK